MDVSSEFLVTKRKGELQSTIDEVKTTICKAVGKPFRGTVLSYRGKKKSGRMKTLIAAEWAVKSLLGFSKGRLKRLQRFSIRSALKVKPTPGGPCDKFRL